MHSVTKPEDAFLVRSPEAIFLVMCNPVL